MPTPAFLLSLATLLPLGSFVMLLFMGKRMGTPLAGWLATAFIAMSFGLSLAAMIAWYNGGQMAGMSWGPGDKPIDLSMKWLPTGSGIAQDHPGFLDVDIYVDGLTIAMFNMVTTVALLVHVFSIGYMAEDKRFPRFFTYFGLFCFSMLGLLLGGTLIQLMVFWELLGLSSYLLIGFWHEKPIATNAAFKAFIVNHIGDAGFLVGIGILFYLMGDVGLLDSTRLLGAAGKMDGNTLTSILLPNGTSVSAGILTVMGIALFWGAIGKAAQFPLQIWLVDAVEAPIPASALIHGATMVAAGVYLLGRVFPILTPDAKLFIGITGLVTLTMAALIAVVQTDIRKVLAYSTISQLGYMVMAIGIGSFAGGLFHLITHAFFKALLFLACGSVIRATGGEHELPQFGGLLTRIPVTAVTFGVGVLAIAGTPFFSGFYSQEMILSHAGAFATLAAQKGHSSLYWAFFILPVVVSYITAFYMMRCWMLVFWGRPRNVRLFAGAVETPALWFPLVILAGLSIIGGSRLLDIKRLVRQSQTETENFCNAVLPPGSSAFTGFEQAWNVELDQRTIAGADPEEQRPAGSSSSTALLEAGHRLANRYWLGAFAVGLLLGFVIYLPGYAVTNKFMRFVPVRVLHQWLYRGMDFEEMYWSVFAGITIGASRFLTVSDRIFLDPLAGVSAWIARRFAHTASGRDGHLHDEATSGRNLLAHDVDLDADAPPTRRNALYIAILLLSIALVIIAGILLFLSK
ncbi:MAG: NADH-quinone oxidoreductase subunit L [Planctomycetota bacterium]|nr:NADH-quinone oxidoreductase subunit L [Planctomycetota bacterium]